MRCWNKKRKPKHSTKTKYKRWVYNHYFCEYSYTKSKSDTSPKLGFIRVHRKWKLRKLISVICER